MNLSSAERSLRKMDPEFEWFHSISSDARFGDFLRLRPRNRFKSPSIIEANRALRVLRTHWVQPKGVVLGDVALSDGILLMLDGIKFEALQMSEMTWTPEQISKLNDVLKHNEHFSLFHVFSMAPSNNRDVGLRRILMQIQGRAIFERMLGFRTSFLMKPLVLGNITSLTIKACISFGTQETLLIKALEFASSLIFLDLQDALTTTSWFDHNFSTLERVLVSSNMADLNRSFLRNGFRLPKCIKHARMKFTVTNSDCHLKRFAAEVERSSALEVHTSAIQVEVMPEWTLAQRL